MENVQCEDVNWSDWYRMDDARVSKVLPNGPGVYEIRTDFEISRVNGRSEIVTIGSAKDSLNKRIYQQRIKDPARYFNRVEKWLRRSRHVLEFRYTCTSSGDQARYLEALLLWQYENKHWEIPPGNDKLEQTVIQEKVSRKLGSRSIESVLSDHNKTQKEISDELDIPEYIVENLKSYHQIA